MKRFPSVLFYLLTVLFVARIALPLAFGILHWPSILFTFVLVAIALNAFLLRKWIWAKILAYIFYFTGAFSVLLMITRAQSVPTMIVHVVSSIVYISIGYYILHSPSMKKFFIKSKVE